MLSALLTLLTTSSLALANHPSIIEKNLVYRSPYVNEPILGIDTHAISERHIQAKRMVERDIESGLVKRDGRGIYKRDAEQPRPDGEDSTYKLGYGYGYTTYDTADYVYAGGVNFSHGVASGDPYDYSVILWTRVEPTDDYLPDIPMCVEYKVWSGEDGTGECVSSGYALTGEDVDWTVKVEATGLSALNWYSYQFHSCSDSAQKSAMGRTRTAPGKTAKNVPAQRFSVYSCSNYPNGYFNAYSGPVVHQDSDFVIHLGDYIYETGGGGKPINRVPSKGAVIATLDDYRKRYAQYRTDPDLAEMHRQFAMIAVWDDHETANNDWKGGSSASNDSLSTGGCAYSGNTTCFSDRAAHAKRAYHEWIPIRQVDIADDNRIWRDFHFGDLLDIFALDTRKYDRDITDLGYNKPHVANLAVQVNSSRSITGPVQEKWLLDGLKCSAEKGTKWRFILNQLLMGTHNSKYQAYEPKPQKDPWDYISLDAWDSYQGSRQRLLQHLYDHSIDNVAAVSGDSHANWLHENSLDTVLVGGLDPLSIKNVTTKENSYQRGTLVEFGGTAVSSSGWGSGYITGQNASIAAQKICDTSPALLYSEGFYRGYMHVEISYDNITTTWYSYPDNEIARVPNSRTQAFQAVQLAGMNQVQRPLQKPRDGFGATKSGN